MNKKEEEMIKVENEKKLKNDLEQKQREEKDP